MGPRQSREHPWVWLLCALLCVPHFAGSSSAADIKEMLAGLPLPARVKSRRDVARWDEVDKVLNTVVAPRLNQWIDATRKEIAGQVSNDPLSQTAALQKRVPPGSVAFSDLFQLGENLFFPLTNSVLKLAPAASLDGLDVYDEAHQKVGTFAGKSRFEKTSRLNPARTYVLISFEYKTETGDFRSPGDDNLLDRFQVRWADLKTRPAIDLSGYISP